MKTLAAEIADDKKEMLKILELMKSPNWVMAQFEQFKRRNDPQAKAVCS